MMNHLPAHISEWKQLDNFQYLQWCKYGITQWKSKAVSFKTLSKACSLAITRGTNPHPDEAFWCLSVLPGEPPPVTRGVKVAILRGKDNFDPRSDPRSHQQSLRAVPILGLPVVRGWVGAITGPWTWHRWMMAGIGGEQVGKGYQMSPNISQAMSGLWRSRDLFPFPWPGILFLVPTCLSSPHSCLYPSVRFSGCLWWPVPFSRSVVSDSLWPHGRQHARPPCPSSAPGVCSNSRPLSQWCHPTISSSVSCISSRLQSFLASGSFPVCQLVTWGGQSIKVSASASALPMNIQDCSPLGWTGWIS